MNHRHHTARRPAARRHGFTLVELMISVAIALLLIVGVSQVFKMSGDTAGAVSATGNIVRDQRAAQATMTQDVRNCVDDSPMFLISSSVSFPYPAGAPAGSPTGIKAGFHDANAQNNAVDPTKPNIVDINGQQVTLKPTSMSDRIPRLDRMAFFARGLYQSQTPRNNTVARNVSSQEAFIWYGHTRKPSNSAGVADILPEDQYASERVLGRVAMLLKDPTTMASGPGSPMDLEHSNNDYPAPLIPSIKNPLRFLDYDAIAKASAPDTNVNILQSRFDICATTIDDWRRDANVKFNDISTGTGDPRSHMVWFRNMEDSSATRIYRFTAASTMGRPINAKTLSQATPFFLGNCTQFVVEYAGDFLTQDPTPNVPAGFPDGGRPTDAAEWWVDVTPGTNPDIKEGAADGEIDYIVDPVTKVRRIRWYGLPRDTNGDGLVGINDVVPFADLLDAANDPKFPTGKSIAPWEKQLPAKSLKDCAGDYATLNPATPTDFKYTCAWHNGAPPLIRVLVKVDDPARRVQDGQWYEFVFRR